MLKDYLDRYLIEAFGIQDSPLEKALLSTDRRNSVEKELEYRAVLDTPIPIPGETTTSAYGVILWILTSTELKPNDRAYLWSKGCYDGRFGKTHRWRRRRGLRH